ncbi:MAG: hypothetical protein AAF802_02270 [Planctomycetota bacterium]
MRLFTVVVALLVHASSGAIEVSAQVESQSPQRGDSQETQEKVDLKAWKRKKWKEVRRVEEFGQLLLKMAELRELLKTGSFSYSITKYQKNCESIYHRQKGEFAFDFVDDRYVHLWTVDAKERYRPSKDFPVEVIGEFEHSAFAATSRKGDSIICSDEKPAFVKVRGPFSPSWKKILFPFEFRTLGLALMSEYQDQSGPTELIINYLGWADPIELRSDDGEVIWRSLTDLVMETKRDLWITKNRLVREVFKKVDKRMEPTGKYVVSTACDLELKKISGRYLPKKIVYDDRSERHTIEIEWKTLNKPLDDGLFEEEAMILFIANDVTTTGKGK